MRNKWTDREIDLAKNLLGQSETIGEACRRLEKFGIGVTKDALHTAFTRHVGSPPRDYLSVVTHPESADELTREEVTGLPDGNLIVDDDTTGGYTVIIPDCHFPYHSESAWQVTLKAIRKLKPERIVVIGDFGDCYTISSFGKSPHRQQMLKHELDLIREGFNQLFEVSNCPVDFTEGNHEFRLETYLCRNAPALYGLVTMKDLITRDHPETRWVPYRKHLKVGRVLYTHDLGYAGVYAGHHTLRAAGANAIFGHTHRSGLVTDGDHTGDRRFSLNIGWLGDISQIDYMHQLQAKDWINGFGVLYTDKSTGLIWPSFVPVLNNSCHVGGHYIKL
jgi:metallophosphoesterase superfamily enzyme